MIEARLASLRLAMGATQLDALLITSRANIRYLTGFSGSSGLLVVTMAEQVLLTDFRYQSQAVTEVGDAAEIVIEPVSLWTRLGAVLPRLGKIRIAGFDPAQLHVSEHARLVDKVSTDRRIEWRTTPGLVESLRVAKSAGELRHIREAISIAEHALDQTIRQVRVGLSELEVCGLLEDLLRRAGSETHPFEAIVAAGARTALPHARSTKKLIVSGDWLLIDFGAVCQGYCCDLTRTFVVGTASAEQRTLHSVVRESNLAASGAVRAGMRGRAADALARDYIDRHGWGAEFGHSLGHGIGLEVHEAPRLARTNDAVLPLGAVVTIEPGIYCPDWGGVRIEDDVHLGPAGPEVLSRFPRELLELG